MAKENTEKPITGHINVHRLMAVLSDILSEQYDMKITMTARPKDATAPADNEPVSA